MRDNVRLCIQPGEPPVFKFNGKPVEPELFCSLLKNTEADVFEWVAQRNLRLADHPEERPGP